ncbi:MAG: FtsQ-type POTRA domain-containing protein [Clostridia bacterium]|nr:FtsQ-type POTRA domain-containing protein [Clostridia bacterium]
MENDPFQRQQSGSQEPLRDWQKDTWYGPYPMHENPFDEPEDAPELLDLRSDSLKDRSGEFWQTQTSGYQFGQNSTGRSENAAPKPKTEKKKLSKGRKLLLASGILAGLILIWTVLNYSVFSVRRIEVIGNSQIPDSEVIRLSEIRMGMPILSLDVAAIERGIERNAVLKFKYLEKELPHTVVLRVQEREACCWMTFNGIIYTMDKQRTVLAESEQIEETPANLVRVDGLGVRAGAMVGQTVALDSLDQQEVFSTLFLEMKVLGCTGLIEEADLSNLSSLLLTTRDGFTIAMGTRENIHAKLRCMLITREELLRRGYQGGVINVSLPETPIFSPAIT